MDHADKSFLKNKRNVIVQETIAVIIIATMFMFFGYQIIDSFK